MPEFSAIDFESLIKDWIKGLINFAPTMIGAIALYFIGRYIIRFIVKLLKGLMERRGVDLALQGFLLQVVRWILYIALFLTIVQVIGLPATQFIAIITSGFFATTLNKADNEQAIIPNTQLFSNSIINYSREEKRRVYVLVGIGYSSDIQKAREVLLQIAKEEVKALPEPAPVVYVDALADSSVNMSLRYWCLTPDYWECYFRTIEAIKNRFDAAGIEIPFPQVQVHQ